MRIVAVVFFLLGLAASSPAWAQKSGEKPLWMYELPLSTEGGEFRRTMGEGKSVQKATQNAIMGYIRNRNFELGLTVSTEGMESLYAATESDAGNYFTSSSSREQEGLNQGTRLKSEENKIRFRVVESYSETSLLGDVKVWCLIWQPEEGASVRPQAARPQRSLPLAQLGTMPHCQEWPGHSAIRAWRGSLPVQHICIISGT